MDEIIEIYLEKESKKKPWVRKLALKMMVNRVELIELACQYQNLQPIYAKCIRKLLRLLDDTKFIMLEFNCVNNDNQNIINYDRIFNVQFNIKYNFDIIFNTSFKIVQHSGINYINIEDNVIHDSIFSSIADALAHKGDIYVNLSKIKIIVEGNILTFGTDEFYYEINLTEINRFVYSKEFTRVSSLIRQLTNLNII